MPTRTDADVALNALRRTTSRLRALELQQAREASAAKDAGATLAAIGTAAGGISPEGARKMIARASR